MQPEEEKQTRLSLDIWLRGKKGTRDGALASWETHRALGKICTGVTRETALSV